ncbi:hypothetical protein ACQEVZ_45640 [Dactylosporangium sp. CA-152071]|uniref:hypothetical protein n=1 Tax=Dactylosporangium sp. CA-152071 TaxID=3239933 RepID=UPI003D909188
MDLAASSAQDAARQLSDQANDLFRMAAGAGEYWDDKHQLEHLDNNQFQVKQTGYHTDGLQTESGGWSGVGYAGRETSASVGRDIASFM